MAEPEQVTFEDGTTIISGISQDRLAGDNAIAAARDLLPGTIARHTLKIGQRLAAQEIERAIDRAERVKDDIQYRELAEKILVEAQKLEDIDLTEAASKGVSSWYQKTKDTMVTTALANPGTIAIIGAALVGLYVATRKDDDAD